MDYGYKKQVMLPFGKVVEKVKIELAKEGFGVLTEIDAQATLKKKLNVDYDRYVILGACNPPFAYRALQADKNIGLLLPCNVVVYGDGSNVFAATVLPTVAMGMIDDPELRGIAEVVEAKLKKVIDTL